MRFDFTLGPSSNAARRARGPVRRLLVLSDLRGHGADPAARLLERPIGNVDVDNLDAVLARYAPVVQLGADAGGERVEIRRFDDFHPDTLLETLSVFRRLRDVRARLGHPGTFAAAVAELAADLPPSEAALTSTHAAAATPESGGGASMLDQLLGRNEPAPPTAAAAAPTLDRALGTVDALIRQAVAPHIVAAPSPQLPQMLAAVDAAMTDRMRAVLHDPAFQQVEAAWRGVQWLVSMLDLGDTLELHLLHVTRDELAGAATPDGDLWRRLVDDQSRSGGGLDLSTVIGNFTFGPSTDDTEVLGHLGTMAAAIGVSFIAGASPALLGATRLAEQPQPRNWSSLPEDAEARWQRFRTQAAAEHIGLALPRLLFRLPYGKRSDPIAAFSFEEQPPSPNHESFLWGNASFAYAVIGARMLDPDGDPSSGSSIDGLPAFVFTTDDETTLQPPAEVNLSDAALTAIQARGIMPLISLKDRDALRLVPPHSIANPPGDLLA